ncbi:BNR-4 repeat-containing protein [Flavobacterium sp. NG2]|uniref:T9SS type A sorting domain-containing protein n=1 Tax=Flavobacterium sp. NG2 TaxID=3097547 RepID=UPI002A82C1E4|nr:BNR-4 repeat-containing protein [Flavobacterium sp. NG2]WPR70115.1 BNR-4 repeat-containing protein [Flavobacterium sp. NG2]
MKKTTIKRSFSFMIFFFTFLLQAQVTLEKEVKITDLAMYFDGVKVDLNYTANSTTGYDYVYGRSLTPHGDCIKVYDKYVFMTWYRGGKNDRHVMLTRYNTETGTMKTIEFPHQHTGYDGKWWIGETHNTISVGICPKNGTIHMLYDMHRNANVPLFVTNDDVLRYSYTVPGAATVPDAEFTIEKFVQSPNNNYKHASFPGINDANTTGLLTYPDFFTNDQGDLFMKNRFGYSENGRFLFAKYDGTSWVGYTDFNRSNASSYDSAYNWGLYGDIKFLNGKIRVGFQQRANLNNDKYEYQNGFYYAYSDDPSGLTQWKDHAGVGFSRPLSNSNLIKISEPGDLVTTTEKDKVYMVSGFDWTVTDNNDVHFIGRVKDNSTTSSTAGQTKQVHTYKPAGATNFITTTDFSGAETLYANGNFIYIVGLNSSGRPYVERAPGGTNSFTRIYEANSGKTFEKGQVYISSGKLYYYLLEKSAQITGDARPTYLQIIDLGIDNGPKPFAVDLVTPTNNQSFEQGKTVALYANATTDAGALTRVDFKINDQVIASDTSLPYSYNWVPQTPGDYTIQAVAYNDSNANVSSSVVNVTVTAVDKTNLTGDIYRLKNVATGQFLQAQTASSSAVLMNNASTGQDKEWAFVKTTVNNATFYNIDSEVTGILRATGSGFTPAYAVVNTTKASPATDSDKIWTVHYIEADNTYRFEAGTGGRFLYHDVNGTVNNSLVPDTDARSKWQVISTTLGVEDFAKSNSVIKLYPNPSKNEFTLEFKEIGKVTVNIYDVLGRVVYSKITNDNNLVVPNNGVFKSGIYLVKVATNDNNNYFTKLVIE